MTFEEFFTKKKIDLDALKAVKPSLYNEFKNHYEQMSEKSFDHSKKFWFNNLRAEFPLKEQPKASIVKSADIEEAPSTTTNDTAKSSSGYKPLFRKKIDPST
ncbi:hypothetical protein NF867_10195 [Solitalea sp. MAHUQ-68]|uniref:Uncharacterized protein n=1 Tax=Solitalea agri TaxID=2953739 RepID=A0A9X2F221_9SPHI|nr:hypothetical protein [Solitalea agri]MCO4293234.1 hypothetical protein [Solitalea agri]